MYKMSLLKKRLNLLTGHTKLPKTALTVEMKHFAVILARKKHMFTAIFFRDWTSKTVRDVPAPAALCRFPTEFPERIHKKTAS